MVENCAIRFAFRANLSVLATHHRCAGDPLGQMSVVIGNYVAGRSVGYDNQALYCSYNCILQLKSRASIIIVNRNGH